MTCTACDVMCQNCGTHRNGLRPRFRCPNCKKTYTEAHKRLIEDMNLADEKALLALQLLIEGSKATRFALPSASPASISTH